MITIKQLGLFTLFFSSSLLAQVDASKHRNQTDIPTLYEVTTDSEKYYEDEAGQYRLTGVLMDLGGRPKGLGEDLSIERVKQNAIGKFGEMQPDSVRKTPVTGIYELLFGKLVKYMDGSGRFLFRGGELQDSTGASLTTMALGDAASNVAEKNLALVNQISESEMLIYRAKEQKHVLTVFTDTDCPYCRQFHKDIPEYTKRGITVRYLFFPRAGEGSAAYQTAISVWCSDNQQEALAKSEKGLRIVPARCENPINKHLELANQLNLLGTPVLILENGEMMYGYSHPNEVMAKFKDDAIGLALN